LTAGSSASGVRAVISTAGSKLSARRSAQPSAAPASPTISRLRPADICTAGTGSGSASVVAACVLAQVEEADALTGALRFGEFAEQRGLLRTGDMHALPARERGFECRQLEPAQGVVAGRRREALGVEREAAVAVAEMNPGTRLVAVGHVSFHRST